MDRGAGLEVLRQGSSGEQVRRWQLFLVGRGHLNGDADGAFGPLTSAATKAYQRESSLDADGVVGPRTLGRALMDGFDIGIRDPAGDVIGMDDPPRPDFGPLDDAARKRMFGEFRFRPAPTAGDAEAIEIRGSWERDNIETVHLPQLEGKPVFGTPSSGRMRFHRAAVPQLKALWQAWEDRGLLDLVLTYEGSFNPRFIRGSTTTLSNHAYGSAFDINQPWNRLGAVPALRGREGSVRKLAAVANEFGFYWGGHYRSRPDGMHFELAKLIAV